MIADDQVEGPEFERLLFELLQDAGLRESMMQAAHAQKTRDAVRLLADEVERAAGVR